MNLLKTLLQIRAFQLAGIYMVESEASKSQRGNVENQLEV